MTPTGSNLLVGYMRILQIHLRRIKIFPDPEGIIYHYHKPRTKHATPMGSDMSFRNPAKNI